LPALLGVARPRAGDRPHAARGAADVRAAGHDRSRAAARPRRRAPYPRPRAHRVGGGHPNPTGVDMKDLRDKVAVVTGAASGIGRALAERFAAEGMKVVLADIEEGPLAEAEAALQASGATTLAVVTDVASGAAVESLGA